MTFMRLKKATSQLINKSFKKSDLSKKTFSSSKIKFHPCITVSRETGSGGRLITHLVAKKLRLKLYDKEFVDLIAKSAKKRKSVIESLDEKSHDLVESIAESLKPEKDKLSYGRYFKYLCETILSLAKKNRVVILGRGANFIIPPQHCLRVRVVAPLKFRIANTIKYEKKSPLQASKHIKKKHYSRKDFVRRYFFKDISNANYYDLVINTKHLSLKQAVTLIIKAYKERFPQS